MSQTRQESSMQTMMKSMLIGSIAGAVEVAVDHPFWSIKTLLQKGEKMTLDPRIIYRGLLPNMLSMVPITAVQFGANAGMKAYIDNPVANAFMAGVSAASIACPIEMGMTRQNATGTSFVNACKQIIAEGGMQRMYTGMAATAFRDGVYTTAVFVGKSMMKPYTAQVISNEKVADIAAAMSAGISAGLVTHPVDTVKTRQQAANKKMSFTEVARQVYQEKGILGFFKGSLPRSIRIGSAVVIFNKVTEEVGSRM